MKLASPWEKSEGIFCYGREILLWTDHNPIVGTRCVRLQMVTNEEYYNFSCRLGFYEWDPYRDFLFSENTLEQVMLMADQRLIQLGWKLTDDKLVSKIASFL
jgi:hypothetical protein